MSVQIVGSVFGGGGKPGDFSWMLQQPTYDDAFFVYNDNEECFVAHQKDPKDPQGCAAGSGNAEIRPYQCTTSRVLGVPTGTLSRGGYPDLTPHVKGLIDTAIAAIRQLLGTHGYKRLIYSAANAQGDLGTGTFTVAPAVSQYIVAQIRTLGSVTAPHAAAAVAAAPAPALASPQPQQFSVKKSMCDYLAFYYPGNNTDWDNVYGVPYFGNFWVHPFHIHMNGVDAIFHTAEAAYQASKWWGDATIRNDFENTKTGHEAFDKRNELEGSGPKGPKTPTPHNGAYGGYSNPEDAMVEILKAKFSDPDLKAALGATGHAYLLEHASVHQNHRDTTWSDGNDGTGTNHLGLSLMKVREFYFTGQGNPLQNVRSSDVVLACTTALRAEMAKRGLSSDRSDATR